MHALPPDPLVIGALVPLLEHRALLARRRRGAGGIRIARCRPARGRAALPRDAGHRPPAHPAGAQVLRLDAGAGRPGAGPRRVRLRRAAALRPGARGLDRSSSRAHRVSTVGAERGRTRAHHRRRSATRQRARLQPPGARAGSRAGADRGAGVRDRRSLPARHGARVPRDGPAARSLLCARTAAGDARARARRRVAAVPRRHAPICCTQGSRSKSASKMCGDNWPRAKERKTVKAPPSARTAAH